MTQLEQLQKEYELALGEAKKENEQNEKRVFNFLQVLTSKRIIVRSDLAINRVSIDVHFAVDDTTDKADFCSSFSMAYKPKYNYEEHTYEMPELAMDCGSSGLSTRAEEPYKVERWHLMSTIWDHEKEFTDLLDSLDYTKQEIADQVYQALEAEKDRIKTEEKNKLDAEIDSMIKVGATFDETVYIDQYSFESHKYEKAISYKATYKITKLTSKRVYLEYTENRYGSTYRGISENGQYKLLGRAFGYFKTVNTGYVSLDKLKYCLIASRKNGTSHYTGIADYCSAIREISSKFVEESFEPAEEE